MRSNDLVARLPPSLCLNYNLTVVHTILSCSQQNPCDRSEGCHITENVVQCNNAVTIETRIIQYQLHLIIILYYSNNKLFQNNITL